MSTSHAHLLLSSYEAIHTAIADSVLTTRFNRLRLDSGWNRREIKSVYRTSVFNLIELFCSILLTLTSTLSYILFKSLDPIVYNLIITRLLCSFDGKYSLLISFYPCLWENISFYVHHELQSNPCISITIHAINRLHLGLLL